MFHFLMRKIFEKNREKMPFYKPSIWISVLLTLFTLLSLPNKGTSACIVVCVLENFDLANESESQDQKHFFNNAMKQGEYDLNFVAEFDAQSSIKMMINDSVLCYKLPCLLLIH